MKKVLMVIIAAVMLASCTSPSDYCDKVTRNVDATVSAVGDMTQAIKLRKQENSQSSKDNLKKTYEEGVEVIKKSWSNIHGMSDYRGDDGLRLSADTYVGFYADYYSHQLKEVVEILVKDSTSYDDEAVLMEYIYELAGKEKEMKANYQKNLLKFMTKNELSAGL